MPAYIIARVKVTNWDRYREYTKLTPAAIARFGGRFIVRGGEMLTLEGPPEKRRLVIIEFPDLGRAKAFYRSKEYSRAKRLRQGAATGQFLAIDGVGSLSPRQLRAAADLKEWIDALNEQRDHILGTPVPAARKLAAPQRPRKDGKKSGSSVASIP